MESEFDENFLKQKLLALSNGKKIFFMLAVCERIFPNFVIFARESGHKGEDILRSYLNMAWEKLQKGKTIADFSLEADDCQAIAPDTEDYETILVSSALDAAAAISLLMQFFTDNDVDHIVEAASLARDSVDMYVQDIEKITSTDPNFEKLILTHPLMQTELIRQRKDVELLKNLSENIEDSYSLLREKWFDTKKSCLELKID